MEVKQVWVLYTGTVVNAFHASPDNCYERIREGEIEDKIWVWRFGWLVLGQGCCVRLPNTWESGSFSR